MFKKIILISSILFFSSASVSSTELRDFVTLKKEISCSSKDKIFKILTSAEARERPIWAGHDPESKTTFALFENEQDKTFTIIQIADSVACVLGMGVKSQMINQIKNRSGFN